MYGALYPGSASMFDSPSSNSTVLAHVFTSTMASVCVLINLDFVP